MSAGEELIAAEEALMAAGYGDMGQDPAVRDICTAIFHVIEHAGRMEDRIDEIWRRA